MNRSKKILLFLLLLFLAAGSFWIFRNPSPKYEGKTVRQILCQAKINGLSFEVFFDPAAGLKDTEVLYPLSRMGEKAIAEMARLRKSSPYFTWTWYGSAWSNAPVSLKKHLQKPQSAIQWKEY